MVYKMPKKRSDREVVEFVAKKVKEAGGRTFYVGGCVRDEILGKENKDLDIEVHGIPLDKLREILQSIGYLDERKVGDSFGVMALRGRDIDISMPRSEEKTGGGGHKDFAIIVDPFIGYEKAARRRDFTMNALMKDVLTGEIFDFYGGLEDIKKGVIRHVDSSTFGDDPLRVLRAAQFAARFGFSIADETAELSKSIDLSKLSHERVAGELIKALLKSGTPSVFFDELRKMDQLSMWFPEVEALIGCEQNPKWHPEGDAYNHTMLVLNEAASCREQSTNPKYFMVAALCHDFGKPKVTFFDEKKGKLTSFGHDKAGGPIAAEFVARMFGDNHMKKYVEKLVELHMTPLNLTKDEHTSDKAYMKAFDKCSSPEDLILLSKCDNQGKGIVTDFSRAESILRAKLEEYKKLMARPRITGIDLINAGFKPGAMFSVILDYSRNLHLSGIDKDQAIKQILGEFKAFRDSNAEKNEPETPGNDYV